MHDCKFGKQRWHFLHFLFGASYAIYLFSWWIIKHRESNFGRCIAYLTGH